MGLEVVKADKGKEAGRKQNLADVPAAVRDMWKLIDASEKNKAAH